MRTIKYIVVHCTATAPTITTDEIRKYWREVRKWDKPGYHFLIKRNGDIRKLLDENEISYGAHGHNQESIHLAYIGGIDKKANPVDNRSARQIHAMVDKLMELGEKYSQAQILGHRDFPGVNKACPSFDVREWLNNYEPELKQAA